LFLGGTIPALTPLLAQLKTFYPVILMADDELTMTLTARGEERWAN